MLRLPIARPFGITTYAPPTVKHLTGTMTPRWLVLTRDGVPVVQHLGSFPCVVRLTGSERHDPRDDDRLEQRAAVMVEALNRIYYRD